MSDVKRYAAAGDGIVRTDEEGPLVLYSDYASLNAEVARLKQEKNELAVMIHPVSLKAWIAAKEGKSTK